MEHGEPGEDGRRDLAARLAILAVWVVLAGYLAWHHVFWRDEVRALSLALAGDNWGAMLRGVQGEGHPALWYVLLRGAHDLAPVREVLPVMAGVIGLAMASVFALRAPFPLWRIALVLFGAFALYEYTVSARNYGISALILFVLADRYGRHRDKGVLLGLLLALLCNTNVHSSFIAAAFLLFWALELLSEDGWRWTPRWRVWVINSAIAALGAALCAVTIYPPANDAAPLANADGIGMMRVLKALSTPAEAFAGFAPDFAREWPPAAAILAVILLLAPVGLIRTPAAFISSLLVLVAFQLFFNLVYFGFYRHQGLFLVYLVVMYWLQALGRGGQWPAAWRGDGTMLVRWARIGGGMFVALLAVQLPNSVARLVDAAQNMPASNARNVGNVLRTRGLENAIVVADPDLMLEPLPYYCANRLYMMRNRRFGTVVPFTRNARLNLSLAEMLIEMQRLRAHYKVPIVVLLSHALDPVSPSVSKEVYVQTFSTTPEQVRAFEAATTQIGSFLESTRGENYNIYVMR